MISADIQELLIVGLRAVLFQKWKTYPEAFSVVNNVLNSTKSKEEDLPVSGLGPMVQKFEGQGITYDDPVKGYKATYIHKTFGLGFRVTEENINDDQYSIIKKMPKALAKSAYQTREVLAAKIWNNGFTDVGPDGKVLFATDHPLAAGGTGSNTLATPADLDVTSLTALINIIERTVDEKGLLQNIKVKKLIVPPELKWTARELLKSDDKPYVATNEINALKDEELKYFVYPWLTDTDAWFLQSDKDEHEMNFFWRRMLKDEAGDDFDTGDLKFKATMRFSVGYSSWRGVAGSEGA